MPFKWPLGGNLTRDQKTFNYHLSKVCVCSEHFFGLLKGRFQSLQELWFSVQGKKDLDYSNMWICSCLILHNFIVEIEEHLGIASSGKDFYKELTRWDMVEDDTDENDKEEDGQGDESYIGMEGQDFHNTLMACLLHVLDQ
ncbi:hypothetical protein BDR04DRAFT_1151703 [Suillus decipiens]|nr:hypothetical protein BDR04DRAFT_1151703 [Suillus decipiens]